MPKGIDRRDAFMWREGEVKVIRAEEFGRRQLDGQQTELVGRALLEAALIRHGFEVARPSRDRGIDLLVFVDNPFRALPLQLKVKTAEGFDVHQKYQRLPDLILAYIWHIDDTPRFFLMTYDEALAVLGDRALRSRSWTEHGYYNVSRPSKMQSKALRQFEDRWAWLRDRLRR